MIELVRSWLVGVTCAALIAALADGLMPKGPVKQVGKLVCALVLLAAVLSPLARLEVPAGALGLDGLQGQVQQRQQELEEQNGQMMKTLIERETAAYIVDKAAQLGLSCQAQVTCQAGSDGTWEPWSAHLTGQWTQEEREQLSQVLESELNIPSDRQSYGGGETP